MEDQQRTAITAHAAFIDRVHELPSHLRVSEPTFWARMGLTEDQAGEIQHQGLFLYDAYHVLETFPQVNPVWLFLGFGKPLLHGYEAELGAVTLLDSLETKEVLLEFNGQRIQELEQTIQKQEVALLWAQAGKHAFREGLPMLQLEKLPVPVAVSIVLEGLSITPQEYPALLEKLRDTPGLIDTPDHSEGMIMFGNQMIKWEIEYWDKEYAYGSPDPTGLSITNRVLILKNPLVD